MTKIGLALCRAKEDQHLNYYFFDNELQNSLNMEMEFARQMSGITTRNELLVEYQPQFHINLGKYVGAEALVRWKHKTKDKLFPDEFMPIAEKRGFIKEILKWVFDTASRQVTQWCGQGSNIGKISINACADQIIEKEFDAKVLSILAKNNT